MALNDTFSLQEMNMDTKDLSSDIKAKELEVYSNNKCVQHPADNHCKVFMIIT